MMYDDRWQVRLDRRKILSMALVHRSKDVLFQRTTSENMAILCLRGVCVVCMCRVCMFMCV